MDTIKKLPIGMENFKRIREEEFYYVDKTGLIKELLEKKGEVNLFTRPRRFGKSLNMNLHINKKSKLYKHRMKQNLWKGV